MNHLQHFIVKVAAHRHQFIFGSELLNLDRSSISLFVNEAASATCTHLSLVQNNGGIAASDGPYTVRYNKQSCTRPFPPLIQ
jgi:hypothetical protein